MYSIWIFEDAKYTLVYTLLYFVSYILYVCVCVYTQIQKFCILKNAKFLKCIGMAMLTLREGQPLGKE